jgi:uncharacterized membrane protein YkvA (DUF1232 family)
MFLRILALLVASLVLQRGKPSMLQGLSSRETDDLLDRIWSDRSLPVWARGLAKGPWLYRQSPIDLLPDFIPLIGRIDDQVITNLALSLISMSTPRHAFEAHVDAVRPGGLARAHPMTSV